MAVYNTLTIDDIYFSGFLCRFYKNKGKILQEAFLCVSICAAGISDANRYTEDASWNTGYPISDFRKSGPVVQIEEKCFSQ